MIALSDRPAVLAAIDRARSVSLSAYILPPAVTERLAAAARRGARVELALAQYPVADTPAEQRRLTHANRDAVDTVRRAGGAATLVPPSDPLHLKGALIDDRVTYLDDRNWSDDGPQTILRDDEPDDVAIVRDALARRPAGNAHLRTVKPDSLALERSVFAQAGDGSLDVQTESFGIGPIFGALAARAAAHRPARLLVCDRELLGAQQRARRTGPPPTEIRALDRLVHDGVDVRVTPAGEKMAVSQNGAWVGSTNATRDWGSTARQLDWGMTIADPAIAAELRARFQRTWETSLPYAAFAAGPNSLRALASVRATTVATSVPSTSATARAVSAT
jgi:hypothetical protein